MTNNNDLWELDRGDYVNIITELRAALAEAERERDEARVKYTADVSGLRNDRDMWRDAAYQAADVTEELERVTSERNVSREAAKMYFEHREKEHSARVASERELDTLRQRWESGPALDALDGVLEAAVDGIDEYAVKYQGRRQEYIDTIRRDIRTVQAAQRAARGDDQPTEHAERELDEERGQQAGPSRIPDPSEIFRGAKVIGAKNVFDSGQADNG